MRGRVGGSVNATAPAGFTAGGRIEAETMIPRSNRQALLDALKQFFKDNPGIE
jgi:hypothetical protein